MSLHKAPQVHLGFEVGTGTPVTIPVQHLAITGQTQNSGKTTTLEALITRSGLRAIAFITKRGEGSFDTGTAILPYFQERADWEFVESVMEATMNEKKKFERSWTIKACRGAHTLADVQRNCQELGAKARRSMDQDLFMLLNEYLSKVVPLVAALPKSPTLVLHPGLNVMDLSGYPDELQSLVISSAIRWIHKHEEGVITIIPEAWKFCPQGRKTPVYVEVKKLAREGAGLKNYIWIDSQDLAGVEKEILRACAVWLIGVQREANEIERALSNIPKGVKRPKVGEIPSLKIGQFFTCFGDQVVKVYVQPAWLDRATAVGMATGLISHAEKPARKESKVDYKVLYEQEKTERERIQQELADLQRRFTEFTQNSARVVPSGTVKLAASTPIAVPSLAPAKLYVPDPEVFKGPLPQDFEQFYVLLKQRLLQDTDPALIKLLTVRPEIQLTVHRKTVQMTDGNMKGRLALLLHEGYFSQPRTIAEVHKELIRRGLNSSTPSSRTSEPLRDLCADGFFYVEDGTYVAVPGMKTNIIEG